jgi:hypothetical protein
VTAREDREREAERRRRIAAAFGEALPEGTRDDRPEGWGEEPSKVGADDEWLRREVPPHHG